MRKKLAATLLTLTAIMASMPTTAFASTETVNPAEKDSFEVVASANVTHEDLAELGLNVVVSFPTEVNLSLDENKAFSGSDAIYAFGIMDTDSTLSITIDEANDAYGKVKYRAADSETGVDSATNFFATVAETLSKESFSAAETLANFLADRDGQAMENFSTLDVGIQNLIPTSGTGIYYTNVPLKIAVQ